MLILYCVQLIPISFVPRIPLSSVGGSFPWCSEFVNVLWFCQGLQKLFDGICSCCCCEKFLLAFSCRLISFFVFIIKIFSRVEGLVWYIIPIIIHTIKYSVGIANCGTCDISGGCRLNRKVPHYIFAVEIIHHWIHERKACFIYWCTSMYVCCWKPRCSGIISINSNLGCGLWCTVVFICSRLPVR